MNGSTNGPTPVGVEAATAHQPHDDNNTLLPRIQQALELVHAPFSSNDSRRDASDFLEKVKADDEAPHNGFMLASDKTQEPVVRHYALSLLEHAIKHKWAGYTEDQAAALRSRSLPGSHLGLLGQTPVAPSGCLHRSVVSRV